MKKVSLMLLALAILASSGVLYAQRPGRVIVPGSSIARPEDAGVRAHTTFRIFIPDGINPDSSSPTGETPASLGCVYKIVQPQVPGCPISGTTVNPNGGSGVIAIIDAFDYPQASNDLTVFSQQFGLPVLPACSGGTRPCFETVYANGQPGGDCGWSEEMSLDIEWAHAMAPNASIVLVEARTNSTNDLLKAEDVATAYIQAHGPKGEATNSWQGSETSNETTFDSHFKGTGVVYFASSGDSGGVVGWPSVSAFVVSAGGTTVHRDSSGNFKSELAWTQGGGGPSAFVARPSWQNSISGIVGSKRGTPDFSYDADPATGVSVYNTNPLCGTPKWQVFGGTSVSSPALAGIINLTGRFAASTTQEENLIYRNLGNANAFRDITTGVCGSHTVGSGWDFCTGVGVNTGKQGK